MYSRDSSLGFNQYNNSLLVSNVLQTQNILGGPARLLRTSTSFGDPIISFVSLGGELTAEALSYYNALNTYLTSI